MTHPTDVDVLIVGAGPTGLTLACLLARYGVKFRIIDRNKAVTDRSKALELHARTLELFEQLEITEKAIEMGRLVTGLDIVARGKVRGHISLRTTGEGLTKYPYILILEQSKTEILLAEKLRQLRWKVDWQYELVDLHQHPDSVSASLAHFERIESIRAKYVVGADGARSGVRRMLQLPFAGDRRENHFLLADIRLAWDFSKENMTMCFSQKGFASFFPMAEANRYRVVSFLSEELPPTADKQFDFFASKIAEGCGVPVKISDPQWLSTYRTLQQHAAKFQVHRCFLAGDAAHVYSPLGGQGMNAGIQDSFNLAWKLNLVLHGKASEKLLNTYQLERLSVSERIAMTTDRALQILFAKNPIFRNISPFLVPLALKELSQNKFSKRYLFEMMSQIRFSYCKSPLSHQNFMSKRKGRAGDRFSGYEFEGDPYANPCKDGLFHAFIMGEPELQLEIALMLRQFLGGQVKIHTLASRKDIHNLLLRYNVPKDGVLLVRPDQYVAYVSNGLELQDLCHFLKSHFSWNPKNVDKDWDNLLDDSLSF